MRLRPDWNHYTYRYGDGDALAQVAFDVGCALFSEAGLPHGVRVLTPAGTTRQDMVERLRDIDALLVGHLTYAQTAEFVAQAANCSVLNAVEARLGGDRGTVHATDGWDYFNARVCPTPADWRRIEDRECIARLAVDAQAELTLVHRIRGAAEALDAVQQLLEPEGFAANADGERLTLVHRQPLNGLSTITVGLMRLCEGHGVLYEGWTPADTTEG